MMDIYIYDMIYIYRHIHAHVWPFSPAISAAKLGARRPQKWIQHGLWPQPTPLVVGFTHSDTPFMEDHQLPMGWPTTNGVWINHHYRSSMSKVPEKHKKKNQSLLIWEMQLGPIAMCSGKSSSEEKKNDGSFKRCKPRHQFEDCVLIQRNLSTWAHYRFWIVIHHHMLPALTIHIRSQFEW